MILLARKVYGLFSAARSAHGTGPRARRMQDIESDTGYDTRRRAPDDTLAIVSQTTGYATVLEDVLEQTEHDLEKLKAL